MNKTVFPALLVATIMVAGAFAFVPVEQASTVHTSGLVTAGSYTAGTVDAAAIATGGVATLEILDDTIGPEDVTGVTDAAGMFHVEEQTATIAAVLSTSYTPIVNSVALVTCTAQGTATGAFVDATLTLGASNGAIQTTAIALVDDVLTTEEYQTSATWLVTNITVAGSVMTCTMGGTGTDGTDVAAIEVIVLYMPT